MEIEVICYTAGLLDGEGSIGRCGNRFNVSIAQGHKNDGERILSELRAQWGGLGSVFTTRNRLAGNHWLVSQWTIGGTWQIERFLTALLPYLRIKHARAEEILAEVKEHIATRRYTWTPEQDEILLRNWETKSIAALARQAKRSAPAIRHRARKLGLPDKRAHCIRG